MVDFLGNKNLHYKIVETFFGEFSVLKNISSGRLCVVSVKPNQCYYVFSKFRAWGSQDTCKESWKHTQANIIAEYVSSTATASASSTCSSTGILSELHATATAAGIQSILHTTAADARIHHIHDTTADSAWLVALSQDKNYTAASQAPLMESSPKPNQCLGHFVPCFRCLVLHLVRCGGRSISSEQKETQEILSQLRP